MVCYSYTPYKHDEKGYVKGGHNVDKVFKITHADIAEYHSAVKNGGTAKQ